MTSSDRGLDELDPGMPRTHRRALLTIRAEIDDAFESTIADGAALVLLTATERPTVTYGPRARVVDEILERADACGSQPMKALATTLFMAPAARAGRYYCVIADDACASLSELVCPRTDRTQLERAREAIAAICLERRGILGPAGATERFAVRAHACSLCTSWALALEERGIDVAALTAPNAASTPASSIRGAHLCAECVREQKAVRALARERFGLGDPSAIEAMMPRSALARLMHLARARTR